MNRRLLAAFAVSLLILAACGGGTEPAPASESGPAAEAALPTGDGTRGNPFVGRGVIQEIEEGRLVIEHENIPGFMAAMTMAFPVSEEVPTESLAVGDRVTFNIEMLDQSQYRIFSVEEMAGQ